MGYLQDCKVLFCTAVPMLEGAFGCFSCPHHLHSSSAEGARCSMASHVQLSVQMSLRLRCRVEYFGLKLGGFHFTEHGWVQSYGSRYVRPPIIASDVRCV